MEIELNPPGSKHEAVLETDWIDMALSKAPPVYKLWWIVTDEEKRRNTEEMLKGQAFGL